MVEIHHADELLQAFDGCWLRKLDDGLDLVRMGHCTLTVQPMPEEVEAGQAKLALVGVEDEPVLGETLENSPKVPQVFILVATRDEDMGELRYAKRV